MSCYEWAKGELTIPSADWARIKEVARTVHNKEMNAIFTQACRLYDALILAGKGKRGFRWHEEGRAVWQRIMPLESRGCRVGSCDAEEERELRYFHVSGLLFRNGFDKRPTKPLKKNAPLANTSTVTFHRDEYVLHFENKTRTLHFQVNENNRAVETAMRDTIVSAVFTALRRVRWTRGSGGVILGNDEYNRDAGRGYAGGGGSYIREAFGPRGEEARADAMGVSVARYRSLTAGARTPAGDQRRLLPSY